MSVEVYNSVGKKLYSAQTTFVVGNGILSYRNKETEYLANTLKALTRSDFMMFGMANALTISYTGGPQHAFNDKSDSKDITGSHPAFIESDFMWYSNANFKKNDTIAMREAYKRGAITGYCYHLGGK